MKTITARQAGILIFFSVIALKAIILPAVIYLYAGTSGYITMFFAFAVDFGILIGYLTIMQKYPNMTFRDIMSSVFGKIITYIVYIFLFIYYFVKTFLIIKSLYNYFNEVVFSEFNWIYYIIPFAFLLLFTIKKNWRVLGRTGEILFLFILVSINIVLFITSLEIDLTTLLPILPNGLIPVANAGIRCAYAFGDYTILIFLIGNIKWDKSSKATIISFAFIAVSTILNFFIVFLCNFGYSVINQNIAIADLSLYIDLAVTVSRLEWIALFAWTITLIFQALTYCYCCNEALQELVPKKDRKYIPYILIALLVAMYCIRNFTVQFLVKYFLTIPFGIVAISIQVGIPILLFVAGIIQASRDKKRNVQVISQS